MRDDKMFVGSILVSGHPALNIFYWKVGAPQLDLGSSVILFEPNGQGRIYLVGFD